VKAVAARPFAAANPGPKAGKAVVKVELPKLLRERGWRVAFTNPTPADVVADRA
jgi:hypothetical protein